MVLVSFMAVSCVRENDVNLDIPQKRKLVAAVIIGAGDSSVSAMLTHSTPVLGTPVPMEASYVSNGSGELSQGSHTWPFFYTEKNMSYTATPDPGTIRAGQEYTVRLSDDIESVSGSTIIPLPVSTSVTMKFDSTVDSEGIAIYSAVFTCTSLSQGSFNIRLLPLLIYTDSSAYPMTNIFLKQDIPSLQKGQSFSTTFISILGSGPGTPRPAHIKLLVLSCDDTYRSYYNSTNGAGMDDLGPIIEPSIAYSNMSNGVGVVASYNVSETYLLPVR